MEQTVYYIIIGLLVFDFILERFLDYLNTTRWSEILPEEVKGIYNEEKYRKQQAYEKTNHRFSMLTDSFSFVLIMLMFLFYGFAYVDQIARGVSSQPIWLALVFFGDFNAGFRSVKYSVLGLQYIFN